MLYSEFRDLNYGVKDKAKYFYSVYDIEAYNGNFVIKGKLLELGTNREKLTTFQISHILKYLNTNYMYITNPDMLESIFIENVDYKELVTLNNKYKELGVQKLTIEYYDTETDYIRLKVCKKKSEVPIEVIETHKSYLVYAIKRGSFCLSNISKLKEGKFFKPCNDTEEPMEVREVTVDFENSEGYTDTYIVAVPKNALEAELKAFFEEAADIWNIAHNKKHKGVEMHEDRVNAANKALGELGLCPDAFMRYVELCYGWGYRKNDESDFKVYY